jgi:hypothetical protein
MALKRLLSLAALAEAATGLVSLIAPSLLTRLLFGAEASGVGIAGGRVTGIALLGLAVACWPGEASACARSAAFRGMLAYSLLAALYLACLGIFGDSRGVLLWPGAAFHGLLSVLLVVAWFKER